MAEIGYNRAKAVEYARRWALDRNPNYLDFHQIGGDCTNFISQCLFSGCDVMNYRPVYGWYYIDSSHRTASWTGVAYLYQFLTQNKGAGPYAQEVPLENAQEGDIIQLGDENGHFYHSLMVTEILGPAGLDSIFISTHSQDADRRRLSSYFFYRSRCLHILGARS